MTFPPPARVSRAELGWLASALVIIVALLLADIALGNKMTLGGALVLTPFLASVGARPWAVCLVGAVALAAGTSSAIFDSIGLHQALTRVVLLVLGTGVAAVAAGLRVRRERRLVEMTNIAETAQRTIIRSLPPVVGSVALGSWYESSTTSAGVGGDCYEALDTPFGTRLMVGDVRGHGLRSVGLAAFTLGAFRALAYIESGLLEIARELDQLVARYASSSDSSDVDGEEFVTAVLAEVHGDTLVMVNCGHPGPLMVRPEGHVSSLGPDRPALPLGLGTKPELQFVDLPPNARVMLYTDGLVESRDPQGHYFDLRTSASCLASVPLDVGVQALVAQLSAHAQHRLVDDVAVLVFEALGQADEPGQAACRLPNY